MRLLLQIVGAIMYIVSSIISMLCLGILSIGAVIGMIVTLIPIIFILGCFGFLLLLLV